MASFEELENEYAEDWWNWKCAEEETDDELDMYLTAEYQAATPCRYDDYADDEDESEEDDDYNICNFKDALMAVMEKELQESLIFAFASVVQTTTKEIVVRTNCGMRILRGNFDISCAQINISEIEKNLFSLMPRFASMLGLFIINEKKMMVC